MVAFVVHAAALVGRRRRDLAAGRAPGHGRALRLRRHIGFVGESPVTADPSDARTAWFCQGNLYVTHDAGRTWGSCVPRFKRPWHCSALAIAPGNPHTLLLLAQSRKNARRTPGKILRSLNGGATWRSVRAPHYPQLDYNGQALAFDPARPSAALMIGANGTALGALYHSVGRRSALEARASRAARCAAPSSTSSPSPPTAAPSQSFASAAGRT